MPKVLLICMPFAAVDRPSLAVSLLQARLMRDGIECDASYFNVAFARDIGPEDYGHIAEELPASTLAGEWAFAGSLFGADRVPRSAYVDEVLRHQWGLRDAAIGPVLRARELASSFLAGCVASVDWRCYDLVGFTSVCAQNIAALALARRIKERHPTVRIVFGGHNWSGQMGRELHRRFPFVDFAISGEADDALPMLLRRLGGEPPQTLKGVPGLIYREGGVSRAEQEGQIGDLDSLPTPVYDGYFGSSSRSKPASAREPTVPLEMSRGCWWAAGRPCAFCGLNGSLRCYRSKSAKRILSELREVAQRHVGMQLDIVDNVVSRPFLAEVLPQLAKRPLDSPISLKVRADVSKQQVAQMAAAGISLKVGIESLSDHVLALMDKGSDRLVNVRLLKWCSELGVRVDWNLLSGVPGESEEDYRDMARLVPLLRFAEAPRVFGAVVLERFSPYFEDPQAHGLGNPRPAIAYRHVYPFPDHALHRLAYFFEHDYRPGLSKTLAVRRLRREVAAWQSDAVGGRARRVRLPSDVLAARVHAVCDDIRSRQQVLALVREEVADEQRLAEEVDRRLDSLVADGLMLRSGERYIALPVGG